MSDQIRRSSVFKDFLPFGQLRFEEFGIKHTRDKKKNISYICSYIFQLWMLLLRRYVSYVARS